MKAYRVALGRVVRLGQQPAGMLKNGALSGTSEVRLGKRQTRAGAKLPARPAARLGKTPDGYRMGFGEPAQRCPQLGHIGPTGKPEERLGLEAGIADLAQRLVHRQHDAVGGVEAPASLTAC